MILAHAIWLRYALAWSALDHSSFWGWGCGVSWSLLSLRSASRTTSLWGHVSSTTLALSASPPTNTLQCTKCWHPLFAVLGQGPFRCDSYKTLGYFRSLKSKSSLWWGQFPRWSRCNSPEESTVSIWAYFHCLSVLVLWLATIFRTQYFEDFTYPRPSKQQKASVKFRTIFKILRWWVSRNLKVDFFIQRNVSVFL